MQDITNKFDWNLKSMTIDDLCTEYLKLSKSNQYIIYHHLPDKRRKQLNCELEKRKKSMEKETKAIYLLPLSEFLQDTHIKSSDEIALTVAIIDSISNLGYYKKLKDSNFARDDESDFRKSKKKMLEWIEEIKERSGNTLENEHLHTLLSDFEYHTTFSLDELKKSLKKKYEKIYQNIKVPKTRASEISTGIVKLVLKLDKLYQQYTPQEKVLSKTNIENITSQEISLEDKHKYFSDKLHKSHDIFAYKYLNFSDYMSEITIWKLSIPEEVIKNGKILLNIFGTPENYVFELDDLCTLSESEYLNKVTLSYSKYGKSPPDEVIEKIKNFYANRLVCEKLSH